MPLRQSTVSGGEDYDENYENELEGWTEFQDVCKYCYKFKNHCNCTQDVEGDNLRNELFALGDTKKSYQNEEKTTFNGIDSFSRTTNLVYYTAPSYLETTRRGVDNEEYFLKSRFKYRIPSKESRAIMSNLVILRKKNDLHRKLEIQNKIQSEWLSETYQDMFICKTGVISPSFSGDLVIKVFNKTENEIIIDEGSPVGILKCKRYEYD